MSISYEWDIETYDEHGDIIMHWFEERIQDLPYPLQDNQRLVLVRNEWSEEEGLIDRLWAYERNGELPGIFQGSSGSESSIRVPRRFRGVPRRWMKAQILKKLRSIAPGFAWKLEENETLFDWCSQEHPWGEMRSAFLLPPPSEKFPTTCGIRENPLDHRERIARHYEQRNEAMRWIHENHKLSNHSLPKYEASIQISLRGIK